MDTSLSRALTQLPKGTLLRIPEGRGKGVAVFQGMAWVTQHNDPRDVVLAAGESLALDRPGLAIVQALGPASVLVFDTQRHGGAMQAITADAGTALPAEEAGDAVGTSAGMDEAAVERPTSHELHRQALRMRNAAIAEAADDLVDAVASAWAHLRARLWARA